MHDIEINTGTKTAYRKTSSRGAYGHDPFWTVFEEYPLDSTISDIYKDIIYNINSAVVIYAVVESSRCSSKTLQKGSYPYAPLDEALRYMHTMEHLVAPLNKSATFPKHPA